MSVRRRRLTTIAALLSALPQLLQYAGHVQRQDFEGSAYAPRVEAVLQSSTATLRGGPFGTVPAEGGYSVAASLIGDLGIPAAIAVWTRSTGLQSTPQTLGWLNLLILIGACVLLVFGFPPSGRLWLAPVFLLVPLVVPLYSSVDSVAIHGALAVLSVSIAQLTMRPTRPWLGFGLGIALFLVHKLRLVYALYSIGAIVPGLLIAIRLFHDRRPLKCAVFLLLGFTVCEVPWRFAVAARLEDPRVIEKDALPEHNTYGPLVAGIGWTPNPWGIKPWDPWVSQYLADSVRGDAVNLATRESERRAKLVYLSILKERPGTLFWLYLRRIPQALSNYSLFGAAGAGAVILLTALAMVLAIRRRDQEGILAVVPPIAVWGGLVVQTIVLDTRYIYAYPLEFVSAIVLAASIPVALRNLRGLKHGTGAVVSLDPAAP